jgi:nitrate/nitrite-specific signal transduction histidine kinase
MEAEASSRLRRLLIEALDCIDGGAAGGDDEAFPELRERVERLRLEVETLRGRTQLLEEQNDQLANLYVASHQLHSTMDLEVVLALLGEILLNLLGVRRYLLAIGSPGGGYEVISWQNEHGTQPPAGLGLETTDPNVERALVSRQPVFVDPPTPEGTSAAVVPLRLMDAKEEVFGLLLIEQLLPQKTRFTRKDEELLTLLSAQAGSAIYTAIASARLGERFDPVVAARQILNREA